MNVERIAAFCVGETGGNPAGVVVCEVLPPDETMQQVAACVGYSETVFAAPVGANWAVRYFAPESEIAFCGHATIALGAALARSHGAGTYELLTRDVGHARVSGECSGDSMSATLTSPPTISEPLGQALYNKVLELFLFNRSDVDERFPPALVQAGARHLLIALRDRQRLASMRYDQTDGARLMREAGVATICLIQAESRSRFHSRNPFAGGGVYEDPATGAAAAALGGYLRQLDREWPSPIEIIQGEDMGVPCLLKVELPATRGEAALVSGSARLL